MEKNISKKLLAGVCALSGAFILASCDPISAVPTNYDEPIVINADGSAVAGDDNKTGKIYDSVATDRNTKIVSDLLEEVALGRFGSYKEIKDANASDEAKLAFVNKYSKVFHRDGDDKFADKGVDANAVRLNRFKIFYEDIMDRINEFFYNEITSGSYNDDEGKFDESKLWMAHYYEFYDLQPIPDGATFNTFFVTNKLTKKNAYSFLHDLYSNSEEGKRGYIEEKVFPQILKDKLVEEYVYNNNYSSLGRAYARKVNYIKVSYENDVTPWKMLKKYAVDHIINNTAGNIDFEIIAKAIKGFDDVGAFEGATNDGILPLEGSTDETAIAAQQLLVDTLGTDASAYVTIDSSAAHMAHYTLGGVELVKAGNYYKESKLGELLVSYEKAIKAEESGRFPIASEKAELDKFTSSGKSKAYGLREKLISLAKEDYTTDGWFVKNGGLSELPSALRDRLFNINVANTLDDGSLKYEANITEPVEVDGVMHYPMGAYETDKAGKDVKRAPYMRNINGNKFVIPAKSQAYAANPYNYVYQDVDGKAFYIVLVEEAPSTPKLNLESATSYSKLLETKDDVFKTETIAREVAKVLGTKDSYIKDAYTEILKGYEFTFYETSLYEHFKSEYPDLFDDED